MSGWLDFAWLLLFLAIAGWAAAAVAVGPVAAVALRGELAPAGRARRALMLAAVPWLAPLALVLPVVAVAAGKALGWIADHCRHHGLEFAHFCFAHLPAFSPGRLHLAAALLALAAFGLALARFLLRGRHSRARVRTLLHLAGGRGRLKIVDNEQPMAFTLGVREAVVVVSRGLKRRLDRRGLRIVLAHEVAHVRRRDLFNGMVLEVLLLLHLPGVAGGLRAAWSRAVEERADDRVAARFGREAVAATLLEVIRFSRRPQVAGLAVTGADPLARVRRLLEPDACRARHARGFEWVYLALLLATAALVFAAHHRLELLLSQLLAL